MEKEEKKFMPLGWDGIFKKVYGNENKPENIQMLLSLLLNIPFDDLKGKIQIQNNDKILENYNDKKQSQDIVLKVFINDGDNYINLEANIHGFSQSVIDRNVSYITYIFSKQLKSGIPYSEMKPVIQINLTKHTERTLNPRKIADTYLLTNAEGKVLTEKLQIIDIYIENCYDLWYNDDMKDFNPYEKTIIKLGALHCAKDMDEFRKCIGGIDMNDNVRKSIENDVEEFQNDNDLVLAYNEDEHRERLRLSYENEHKRNMEKFKTMQEELLMKFEQVKAKENEMQAKENEMQAKENEMQTQQEKIKLQQEQMQEERLSLIKNLLNEGFDKEKISKFTNIPLQGIENILNNK